MKFQQTLVLLDKLMANTENETNTGGQMRDTRVGTRGIKKTGADWTRLPVAERRQILIDEAFSRRRRGESYYAKHLVYFIQEPASGAIKIGIAKDPPVRLAKLQTAHPLKLVLLASCPGQMTLEKALHAEFAADRLHGEWFKVSDRLMARIAELTR